MKPKRKKRWRPKEGQEYFTYHPSYGVTDFIWGGLPSDYGVRELIGVYKTKAEAIAMRDAIKTFATERIGEV